MQEGVDKLNCRGRAVHAELDFSNVHLSTANRIFGTGWTGTGRYFLFLLKLRVVFCRTRINDKKLACILTKSNLPSEGLFYKLGSYHQLPGSILPNPSPAEAYYPTLVQANGHHPSPVLSILPSAHCAPELAKAFWN